MENVEELGAPIETVSVNLMKSYPQVMLCL